ncbi:phage tail assembly chaperone [Cupriavidus campinensis]|uniref:Phage tail assembly chaperone-like domain-containing protein n=1 Tax=Cupriavidus campinensis TaxID=151783 RepID=A0ABY3ESL5_9BURK|nr:phage tail assembly chaperone [Cupriavidus campinensis]TSP13965.1 hypothetical protein FGG12_05700 [Cupriavidus campinensis]
MGKHILSLDRSGTVVGITHVPQGFENRLEAVVVPIEGDRLVVESEAGVEIGMKRDADGKWVLAAATKLKQETDKAAEVRRKRDSLLSYADKMVNRASDNADAALETAWRRYRKQLRDLPLQPAFPVAVDWPTQP